MSPDPAPSLGGEEDVEEREARSYHPTAPSDDSFSLATTVDPGYIISLIRRLLVPSKLSADDSLGADDSISRLDGPKDHGGVSSPSENKGFWDSSLPDHTREEAGCILWDLSANDTHAEFMVQNLLLNVLLANLTMSNSMRVREISLGILGNVACHKDLMGNIISTSGLVEIITAQLFIDDPPCLCEAFRLLTVGLQSKCAVTWVEALHSEHVIDRLLWVSQNSMNLNLTEKSAGLLLSVIGGCESTSNFLPMMVELGLPGVLIELLSDEMEKLKNERNSERYPILDLILRSIEALSAFDEHWNGISSNKQLLVVLCDLIKLPDKAEIPSPCVAAAVLIANMLTDDETLIPDPPPDLDFLRGTLDILTFASGEVEARMAVWSVLSRLLVRRSGCTGLPDWIPIMAEKAGVIEDDLLEQDTRITHTQLCVLVKIVEALRDCSHPASSIERLLDICDKYTY